MGMRQTTTVAAVLMALLAGCSRAASAPSTTVVLLGDSLAQEAAPYLERLLEPEAVVERFFGGTAPCDWLDQDLHAARGRTVVISFTGNSLTPCMGDGEGGQLRADALVARYRADLTTLVGRIRDSGARVLLVGQPRRGPNHRTGGSTDPDGAGEVDGINRVYADLATSPGVSLVDAGAAVEAPDGTFASTLPCLDREEECGPDGRNAVRSDDGVHFCPGELDLPCPTYSSGAFRFAGAIARALQETPSAPVS